MKKTIRFMFAPMLIVAMLGCSEYTTKRDKTKKGAGIGAAAGAAGAVIKGEREADEILAGAAIGAAAGAGVGAYMDRQEERLARIPGTTVERVGDGVLLVKFDSDVLFDVDSALVKSGQRATVDEVGEVLHRLPEDRGRGAGPHRFDRQRGAQPGSLGAARRRDRQPADRRWRRSGPDRGHRLRRGLPGRRQRQRARPAAEPSSRDPAQGASDLTGVV